MPERGWLVVAAGSNIEPERNLPAALRRLRTRLEVERLSAIYRTPPVEAPGTPDFWNAAIRVRTDLAPGVVKHEILRPIEAELGRVRGDDPNAPRTIDLDLVLWSGGALDDRADKVRLPEPDLARVAHLAVPVAEVAPGWVDPTSGASLAVVAAGFAGRAERVELRSPDDWPAGPVAEAH